MALTPNQQTYAQIVAQDTGLDLRVVQAWVASEGPGRNDSSGAGTFNFLNIGGAGSPRNYSSVQAGADAAGSLIRQSPYYAGIRQSVGQDPASQITAIASSAWAAPTYYGNGGNLANTFNSMFPSAKVNVGSIVAAVSQRVGQATTGPLGPVGPQAPYGPYTTPGQASDSECLVKIPIPIPGIPDICFTRSQGRAVLGAVSLVGGGILMLAGLAMIAGKDVRLPKPIPVSEQNRGARFGGTPRYRDKDLEDEEQREQYDAELAERRDAAQARREANLAGRLERQNAA